ncbi:MAG: hypothetical protein R2796_11390 [Chitinophagaceae bacterium]
MPTNLFEYLNCGSKKQILLSLLLLSPLFFFGQSLSGLWVGNISNDSTVIRQDKSFEIALTEYNGKVYGYSRSEFIVDDQLYYIIKRVKGTINGDVCEVEDDEIVAYNFPKKRNKKVKVITTFKRNKSDNTWQLDGTWRTTATKKYYALTGKIELEEEPDLSASKLFPHLEELHLANTVSFYKNKKEQPVVMKIAKPEKMNASYNEVKQTATTLNTPTNVNHPTAIQQTNTAAADVLIANAVTEPTNEIKTSSAAKKVSVQKTNEQPLITKNKTKIDQPKMTVPVVAQRKPIVQQTVAMNTPIVKEKKEVPQPIAPSPQKTVIQQEKIVDTKPIIPEKTIDEIIGSAATIAGRKSIFAQEVKFHSDSLQLALYDNGEIDGDTVSVYLNGKILLSHQGIKATAIKKTIYITPDMTDFSLVLFAENLGKYPPNTGLLVVRDGDDVYHLRFSSDLEKNAGIIFRKTRE